MEGFDSEPMVDISAVVEEEPGASHEAFIYMPEGSSLAVGSVAVLTNSISS